MVVPIANGQFLILATETEANPTLLFQPNEDDGDDDSDNDDHRKADENPKRAGTTRIFATKIQQQKNAIALSSDRQTVLSDASVFPVEKLAWVPPQGNQPNGPFAPTFDLLYSNEGSQYVGWLEFLPSESKKDFRIQRSKFWVLPKYPTQIQIEPHWQAREKRVLLRTVSPNGAAEWSSLAAKNDAESNGRDDASLTMTQRLPYWGFGHDALRVYPTPNAKDVARLNLGPFSSRLPRTLEEFDAEIAQRYLEGAKTNDKSDSAEDEETEAEAFFDKKISLLLVTASTPVLKYKPELLDAAVPAILARLGQAPTLTIRATKDSNHQAIDIALESVGLGKILHGARAPTEATTALPFLSLDFLSQTETGSGSRAPSDIIAEIARVYFDGMTWAANILLVVDAEAAYKIKRAEWFKESVFKIEEVSLDSMLAPIDRASVLASLFRRRNMPIDAPTFQRLYEAIIQELGAAVSANQNLAKFASELQQIIAVGRLNPASETFVTDVVALYRELSGEAKVGPFPLESIERARGLYDALSYESPVHEPKPVHGQNRILESVEDHLVTWLVRGHKTQPALPFLFLGDSGVGKTMLAKRIAQRLGAAVEIVNVSAISKRRRPRSPVSSRPQEEKRGNFSALSAIQEAVDALRLTPSPVRILVLDEIHSEPGVLRELLPAFGDNEKKMQSSLNLDGLITIMTANTVDENRRYAGDSRGFSKVDIIRIGTQTFTAQIGDVDHKDSDGATDGRVDAKIVNAFLNRVIGTTYVFERFRDNGPERERLLSDFLHNYELANNRRLVLLPAALEYLINIVNANRTGNYRTVLRALEFEMDGAQARSEVEGADTRGVDQLVTLRDTRHNGKALVFRPLGNDEEGIAQVVQDAVSRYRGYIERALILLRYKTGRHNDVASRMVDQIRQGFDEALRSERTPINALTRAQPPNFAGFPELISPSATAKLRQGFVSRARDLFEIGGRLALDPRTPNALITRDERETLPQAARTLKELLLAISTLEIWAIDHPAQAAPFRAWKRDLVAAIGTTQAANNAVESGYALGVALALSAHEFAQVALVNRASERRDRAILAPRAAIGCEELLTTDEPRPVNFAKPIVAPATD